MFPVWYRPLLHQGGLRRVLPGGAGGRALPAGESETISRKFSQNSFRWQLDCTYCRLTSENDIVCDQKVCVHHCLLWPVTSMPAAEMSDKTLLAVAPSSPPPLDHETQWHNVNGIPVLSRVQPRYSSQTSLKPEVIEKWQLLWLGWEVGWQETRGNGNIYIYLILLK